MDAEELAPGTLVGGRYQVEAAIGQGGMATVYRVRHTQLETLHALKVLNVASRSIQRRLMHEGRVQAALRHPNIVAVTDVVDVGGAPGLVMEYIRGPAMDDFLEERRLTVEQADALAQGVLDGVAAAHDLGLIHRDLKPANVMLAITKSGVVPKVADFGLVKLLADEEGGDFSKTRSGVAMGTPAYMAPEQIRDAKNVDKRADIWSIGCILYEMLTGIRAFDGLDLLDVFNKVATGDYEPVREAAPGFPERMYLAVEAALQRDRDTRVADAASLKQIWLGQAVTGSASPWDAGLMSEIESLGGGADQTGEALKRSFRTNSGYKPQSSPMVPPQQSGPGQGPTLMPGGQGAATAVPATQTPSATATDATMDLSSLDDATPLAAQTEVLDSLAGVNHQPAAPIQIQPNNTKRNLGVAIGITGLVALLLTAGLASVLLNGLGFEETEVVVTAPAVMPTPSPVEVVPEEEPPVPVPPTEVQESPEPVPELVKPPPTEPVTKPRPVKEPTVTTAAPVPEEAPATDPGGEAEAPTEPEPTEAPAVEPPKIALDADCTVMLVNEAGDRMPHTNVPPGTYSVLAFFDPANPDTPTEVKKNLVLGEGATAKIKCISSMKKCVFK